MTEGGRYAQVGKPVSSGCVGSGKRNPPKQQDVSSVPQFQENGGRKPNKILKFELKTLPAARSAEEKFEVGNWKNCPREAPKKIDKSRES